MREVKCFIAEQSDLSDEDSDVRVIFVPSGYGDIWIKVTEDPFYNISVKYCKKMIEP